MLQMGVTSLSLQARIVFLVVAIVAIVLFLSTYLDLRLSETTFEEELRDRAVNLAKGLAATIGTPRELEDAGLLWREMEEIKKTQRIVEAIEIFGFSTAGPALIASTGGPTGPIPGPSEWQVIRKGEAATSLERAGGRRLWVTAPIRFGEESAGAIRVRFSLEYADRHAAKERRQTLAIMGAASLLIVGFLGWYLQRNVSRPIQVLMGAMAQAEAGDLASEARLARDDEFGRMAVGFNRMLRKIRESHDENVKLVARIDNFNKELQAEVEKAIRELAARHEELRRVHAMLFDVQRQLSRTERLVMAGQLAAMMAHEIGTPLHSISGHVQLLLNEGDMGAEAIDRLKIIETQIGRVVEILQAILSASAPAEPVFRSIEANHLVNGLLDLMAPVLSRRGVVVASELTGNPSSVIGDVGQLQQVFLNLIANALDAMPDGGTLRVASRTVPSDQAARLSSQEAGAVTGDTGWIEISVADTGWGIEPEHLLRIFDPFFTTKGLGKGTGLGLSICQRIVRTHRGRIEVKSDVGAGTTFAILLPLSGA